MVAYWEKATSWPSVCDAIMTRWPPKYQIAAVMIELRTVTTPVKATDTDSALIWTRMFCSLTSSNSSSERSSWVRAFVTLAPYIRSWTLPVRLATFLRAVLQAFLIHPWKTLLTRARTGAMSRATSVSWRSSTAMTARITTAINRSAKSPTTPVAISFFRASASLVTLDTSLPVLPCSKNLWDRSPRCLKKSALMSAMTIRPSLSM